MHSLHWGIQLLIWSIVSVGVTWVIAKACDTFEGSADYLGRNMPPGIKGSTINAIGSSMPELWTTAALLFFIGGVDSFAAGISVTAGSAVFNSDIIPMLVILAVMSPFALRMLTFGIVNLKSGVLTKEITIDKKAVGRDALVLIFAEGVLIFLLGKETLTWVDGAILVGLYIPYIIVMWWQTSNHEAEESDGDEYEGVTTGSAWKGLFISTSILIVACYILGEAIMGTAEALSINAMIIGLFLGAAASSVPDSILSVKDAIKGNYEDAIGNAVGSNTFDICIALGGPLLVYTLMYGPITMPTHDGIQVLRVALLVFTVLIVGMLLIPKTIRLWHATALGVLYIIWTIFALNTEFKWFTIGWM